MAYERVDISVLVVDDDDTSLAIVANILNSLEHKVLIAKGALNALETLREFGGFLDIVITELHMSGMNGFEFLNRVESEFKLPVIMMSGDRRKHVISKSLANGAAHYILKPFCANDFKDIWQYATAARKRKLSAENNEGKSLKSDGIFIQDVNSATSANENKKKRKYCQRKSPQMDNENQSEERPRLVKKPKVVWTTHLHNLFLLAIKEIGLERAVPKQILEIMNMPNLTRENVASHLQKYRIFLRKVAEKGLFQGLSNRDLKSRFASGLTTSMIKEFQARNAKLNFPALQYMERVIPQTEYREITNALKPYNHVSSTTPLGRCHQFPYPYYKGLNMMLHSQHGDSLNQARLGVQSNYGNNSGTNNIQRNMFGSYANSPYLKNISNKNVSSVFPSMEHGLMTSAKSLRGLKYGDQQLMNQNYGSLGNYHHKFNYGQGNWIMGSLKNFDNNLPSSTSTYNPCSIIQLNGVSQMVGNGIKGGFNSTIGAMDSIANNNNSFGLINETTQNANKNAAPLGQVNFGLAEEGYAFAFASSAEDELSSELPATLITDSGAKVENLSGNTQLHQQLAGNVEKNDNTAMEDNFPDFLMLLDEMDLVIEPGENPDANEFSKSDFSGSSHIVQSLEQSNSIVSDVIVNPIESTIDFPNESPISSDKNCNQLGGEGGFEDMGPLDRFIVDDVSSASNSASQQDWDIDLIEALFGNNETN